MSSKLYKKYLSLKKEDPDTYYLFKICEFSKVDIDSLSISQAFTWLSDLQEQFKKIT